MIHLIRHPKDIVISGYFYHKKGSESWNTDPLLSPWINKLSFELDHILSDEEKKLLNPLICYQQLLEALSFEKGMMVEMVWLKYIHTFNPIPYYQSPIIQTYRFEDIVEKPVDSIRQICNFWQLSEEETEYYCHRADHYDRNPNYPIRNRSAYQYKEYFNDELNAFFAHHFHKVVNRLDYPD
ncbi:MAG: hypothetical protein GY705_23895 [Bacteroidetes bacterium]|nr:hypothetical protein [Bacteroidota bacterium]